MGVGRRRIRAKDDDQLENKKAELLRSTEINVRVAAGALLEEAPVNHWTPGCVERVGSNQSQTK